MIRCPAQNDDLSHAVIQFSEQCNFVGQIYCTFSMGDQRQPVYNNAGFRKLDFEDEQIKDNRKCPMNFCPLPYFITRQYFPFDLFLTEIIIITKDHIPGY